MTGLEQRDRLDARPGITCTWQVTGRSEIPFDEQVMLDIDYIRRQSVRNDLKLLVKTVPAVIPTMPMMVAWTYIPWYV